MIAFKLRFAILSMVIFAFFAGCVSVAQAESSTRSVQVEYFYQPNCEECKKIAALILPPMQEQYGNRVKLEKYDLSEQKNFLRLIAILDIQKNTSNNDVYMVVAGKHILGGYPAVEKQLFPAIGAELHNNTDNNITVETMPSAAVVKTAGEKLKLGMVIAAGLIDGINPCVFSTLVFFMSLLTVAKIRGRKLILIGTAYCAAGFITYLLLGFGLFKLIKTLDAFPLFKTGLNLTMAGILVIFALISFRDAWLFYKSGGDSKQVVLQLPDRLKVLSHNVMKKGLKFHYLMAGSFVIGVLVTLLESVCTGQVYVPTLVLMSNESGAFSKWFGLLLLYNLMFILPLIGVFIMTYCSISVLSAIKLTRTNLLAGKILLGVFFLTLAAIMMML